MTINKTTITRKLNPIASALLIAGAAAISSNATAGEVEDRIAELEAQLNALKEQVSVNQSSIDTQSMKTEAIEKKTASSSGTDFNYGGFIQLDAISSSYSEGKPSNSLIDDFYVPSLVPTAPSGANTDSYSTTNIHAKTSRFFFTTKTATDAGDVSTRIELDFVLSPGGDERISNSWNSRVRHAFVKWDYAEDKSIFAGQSWSTFFNVGALPNLQDFVGPAGTIFVRQPQIRWTSGGLQLAIENPATRLNENVAGVNGTRLDDSETLPDLIARYNGKAGDLDWTIAGMARELSYEDRSTSTVEGASDEAMGYALSLSGKWKTGDKNDLRFMLNYGDALGRYMGLNSYNDGYIGTNGDIETIDQWGATLAYMHHWSNKWRSTFSASLSEADNPAAADYVGAATLAKSYQSFHANLNYLPAPKLQIGGEVMVGTKELENGDEGDLSRVQLSVKYGF